LAFATLHLEHRDPVVASCLLCLARAESTPSLAQPGSVLSLLRYLTDGRNCTCRGAFTLSANEEDLAKWVPFRDMASDQKLSQSSLPVLAGAAPATAGNSGFTLAPNAGRVTFFARFGPRRSVAVGVFTGEACSFGGVAA